MNTLTTPPLTRLLDRLFEEAAAASPEMSPALTEPRRTGSRSA